MRSKRGFPEEYLFLSMDIHYSLFDTIEGIFNSKITIINKIVCIGKAYVLHKNKIKDLSSWTKNGDHYYYDKIYHSTENYCTLEDAPYSDQPQVLEFGSRIIKSFDIYCGEY